MNIHVSELPIDPPAPGEAHEIAPGILWLRFPLPYALNHVNAYLIEDDGGWTLFDTGLADAPTREAWSALFRSFPPSRLRRIIASHFHGDHVGLAGWLAERSGAPVFMTRKEHRFYDRFSRRLSRAPVTQEREFYIANGMDEATTDSVMKHGMTYLELVTLLPDEVGFTEMGGTILSGGDEWTVRTGGGHSPEQLMLVSEQRKVLLAADQILNRISPNVSVWNSDPSGNPLGEYFESLAMFQSEIDNECLVLPGHGRPFYGLHQRAMELEAHHHERCGVILHALRGQPMTVDELTPIVFPRPLDPQQRGFAFGEVLAHVNYLVCLGEASWTDEPLRRLMPA